MQSKSVLVARQDLIQSSQNSKKSIHSSVKTPALLFYKPGSVGGTNQKNKSQHDAVKQNVQGLNSLHGGHGSSMINAYENLSMMEFCCQNHPNMAAKYYSKVEEQDQNIYYCDRCAYLLREQGFTIMAISTVSTTNSRLTKPQPTKSPKKQPQKPKLTPHPTPYPYPQRQTQIQTFLQNLQSAKQELTSTTHQLRQTLIASQQFYGQQIEQINQYFQAIIQSLELEKNKCYNHILLERQNAEREVRGLVGRIGEGQREVAGMICDIEENLDSVYSISWQNYKLVMDTFQGRMGEISRLLNQINSQGIPEVQYRKIQFAGVPQSINSLSQIIIQNSYGSMPDPDPDCSLHLTNNSNISSIHRTQNDQTIFQKLKSQTSEQQLHITQNNLMFSFDGQRMRYISQQTHLEPHLETKHQNPHPVPHPVPNTNYIYEQPEMQIKLRRDRSLQPNSQTNSNSTATIERVEGIKQVEELDVIVTDQDEDQFQPPVGIKFNR